MKEPTTKGKSVLQQSSDIKEGNSNHKTETKLEEKVCNCMNIKCKNGVRIRIVTNKKQSGSVYLHGTALV
jgi:hypothetical protein